MQVVVALGSPQPIFPAGSLINIQMAYIKSGLDKVKNTEMGFCIIELFDIVFSILHKTNSAVLDNAV